VGGSVLESQHKETAQLLWYNSAGSCPFRFAPRYHSAGSSYALIPELKNLVIFSPTTWSSWLIYLHRSWTNRWGCRNRTKGSPFCLNAFPDSTYYMAVLVNGQQAGVGPNFITCLGALPPSWKDQKPSMPFSTPLLYTRLADFVRQTKKSVCYGVNMRF